SGAASFAVMGRVSEACTPKRLWFVPEPKPAIRALEIGLAQTAGGAAAGLTDTTIHALSHGELPPAQELLHNSAQYALLGGVMGAGKQLFTKAQGIETDCHEYTKKISEVKNAQVHRGRFQFPHSDKVYRSIGEDTRAKKVIFRASFRDKTDPGWTFTPAVNVSVGQTCEQTVESTNGSSRATGDRMESTDKSMESKDKGTGKPSPKASDDKRSRYSAGLDDFLRSGQTPTSNSESACKQEVGHNLQSNELDGNSWVFTLETFKSNQSAYFQDVFCDGQGYLTARDGRVFSLTHNGAEVILKQVPDLIAIGFDQVQAPWSPVDPQKKDLVQLLNWFRIGESLTDMRMKCQPQQNHHATL
ncbi:MAG: hypothetical protein ABSE82_14010, partial [Nitrososphaerales archaeon]